VGFDRSSGPTQCWSAEATGGADIFAVSFPFVIEEERVRTERLAGRAGFAGTVTSSDAITTSLVSPVFVGRRDERAQLIELLGRTVDGAPGIALIGGEAGVGKSRLVTELVAEAGALDMRVLFGNCVQLGSEGLPFAPLVDALRVLSRTMVREDFDRVLGPARRPLLRLLPNLDSELPAGAEQPEVQGRSCWSWCLAWWSGCLAPARC
jgi:hypothetical protein